MTSLITNAIQQHSSVPQQSTVTVKQPQAVVQPKQVSKNSLIRDLGLLGSGSVATVVFAKLGNKKDIKLAEKIKRNRINEKEQKIISIVKEIQKLENKKHILPCCDVIDNIDDVYGLRMDILKEKPDAKLVIPNSIMLKDGTDDVKDLVIDYCKAKTSNFIEMKFPPQYQIEEYEYDCIDKLEDKTKDFCNKSKRTMFHIENFEDVLNPKKNDTSNIADVKRLLNNCTKKNGTTIFYKCNHPELLEKACVQEGRVTIVDCNTKSDIKQIKDIVENQKKIRILTDKLDELKNVVPETVKKGIKNLKLGATIGVGLTATILVANYLYSKHKNKKEI